MARLFGMPGVRHAAKGFVRIALILALAAGAMPQAKAVTVFLDFVTSNTADMFGVTTTTANLVTAFGFTTLDAAQVQASLLSAVQTDYLGYPTIGVNGSSPLPDGRQLNIDFLIYGTPSLDPQFHYVNIGNDVGSNSFFGQACLGCVRGGALAANGTRVGSILANTIATLASLATTDAERINLLAGTISHEIGHSVSLNHPSGALPNPGASSFSIMGTGATPTNMPNAERVKDRAFSYTEFAQLITAIGTRDATAVPEPISISMIGAGLALLIGVRMRRPRA